MTNAAGCDSVVTLDLTLTYSTSSTDVQTACDQFTWIDGNTYTTSNSTAATQTFTNAVGCDSVVTLDLTIQTVNTSVNQNGSELSANQTGGQYQWVNCPDFTIISGATSATFNAGSNGEYAVIVTSQACTDTSVCYAVESVSIAEKGFEQILQVYPNPSFGEIWIKSSIEIPITSLSLFNALGAEIDIPFNKIEGSVYQSKLSTLEKGVYFIELNTEAESFRYRFVLQ